jgi:dihydroorotate dehydrogenase (NAD+) catalytic subunit
MIELAPDHKIGLPLSKPVLLASGCAGYGLSYQRLLDLTVFGAIVTNPITLRSRRGTTPPRLAETKAGFILNTGQQNPGVRQVIQQYSPGWTRLKMPVIAHLPADEPDDLRRTAGALAGTGKIAAIELGVPFGTTARDLEGWVTAVREACLLPLLVKLPLETAIDLAGFAKTFAVDALVIGAPPLGAALSPLTGKIVNGYLFGPALYNLVLHRLQIISELVDLPLVAAGGIHSQSEAQALLQAGAAAVQLDTLIFIDPRQAENIARNLAPE